MNHERNLQILSGFEALSADGAGDGHRGGIGFQQVCRGRFKTVDQCFFRDGRDDRLGPESGVVSVRRFEGQHDLLLFRQGDVGDFQVAGIRSRGDGHGIGGDAVIRLLDGGAAEIDGHDEVLFHRRFRQDGHLHASVGIDCIKGRTELYGRQRLVFLAAGEGQDAQQQEEDRTFHF